LSDRKIDYIGDFFSLTAAQAVPVLGTLSAYGSALASFRCRPNSENFFVERDLANGRLRSGERVLEPEAVILCLTLVWVSHAMSHSSAYLGAESFHDSNEVQYIAREDHVI
jgi:hypothetical protein